MTKCNNNARYAEPCKQIHQTNFTNILYGCPHSLMHFTQVQFQFATSRRAAQTGFIRQKFKLANVARWSVNPYKWSENVVASAFADPAFRWTRYGVDGGLSRHHGFIVSEKPVFCIVGYYNRGCFDSKNRNLHYITRNWTS